MTRARTLRLAVSTIALLGLAASAGAQVLVANDDLFGIRYGLTLEVEPFGVLENDELDGENAGESGATAVLVTDASHGTLNLYADGSFTYSVGANFPGEDSFVYRAEFGAASSEATVTLSACEGGPDIYTCWHEDAFLDLVADLGYGTAHEGFEDDGVWGHIRTPNSAMSVASHGVEWSSNHTGAPAYNPITTSSGPPHSGMWGIYDANHGYATGTPGQCDIDDPPEHCLYHDGISGTRLPGESALHGVGGWFTGIYGAKIAMYIDGAGPYGDHNTWNHSFFGIVDTRPAGFTHFEFRELDGKIGQAFYVWGDDFTLVGDFATAAPELEPGAVRLSASPNPARSATTLRLALGDTAALRLDVYDIAGRHVRTLGSGHRPGADHRVDWDLRDDEGNRVSAGIYFARLVTTRGGSLNESARKIVVLH